MKKFTLMLSALMVCSLLSFATTFTAVSSGNWSSSATWTGGNIPPTHLIVDQVIIPVGITVTSNNYLQIDGALAVVNVIGALEFTGTADSITIAEGDITGTGDIVAGSLILDTNSVFTFAGIIELDYFITSSSVVQVASHTGIHERVIVRDGLLTVITGGQFLFDNGVDIEIVDGSLAVSGTGAFLLSSDYNVIYSGSSVTAGLELQGNGLEDVTVDLDNAGGTVTLTDDLTITNTLFLNNGSLVLNGNNLVITGNFNTSNNGSITSTSSSNISVTTSNSPAGHLKFATGGNVIGGLTVNITSFNGMLHIDSSVTVQNFVTLANGTINIGNSTFTLMPGATITGAGSDAYFVTGNAGKLAMTLTAGGNYMLFPVGTESHYAPASVKLNSGSASGMIMVHAQDSVRVNGATGAVFNAATRVVNNTWLITSDITSNLDMDLRLSWNSALELNGFNRDSVYISHFTNGSWDSDTTNNAPIIGGLYTAERSHITSLSPFAVFGNREYATGIADNAVSPVIEMYPNPVNDMLYIRSNGQKAVLNVFDIQGNLVNTYITEGNTQLQMDLPQGTYMVKIESAGKSSVQRLVKL